MCRLHSPRPHYSGLSAGILPLRAPSRHRGTSFMRGLGHSPNRTPDQARGSPQTSLWFSSPAHPSLCPPLLPRGPSAPSPFSVSCQSPWYCPSLFHRFRPLPDLSCFSLHPVSLSARVVEPLVPPLSPQPRPRARPRPIPPGPRPQERSAAGQERPLARAHAPCSRLQSPPKGPSRLRAGRPERVRPPARSVSLVPPVTSDPVTAGWGWAGRP